MDLDSILSRVAAVSVRIVAGAYLVVLVGPRAVVLHMVVVAPDGERIVVVVVALASEGH